MLAQLFALKPSIMLPYLDVYRLKSLCDTGFNLAMVGRKMELECRLGTHLPRGGGFQPGVSKAVFERLLAFHRRGELEEFYQEFDRKVTVSGYRVDTYLCGVDVQPGQVFYSHKTKLEHMDSSEYNLRIALAEEVNVTTLPPSESLAVHRMIRRFTFNPSPGLRLDLSIVQSTDPNTGREEEIYEVELELVTPFKVPNVMCESFMYAVEQLVSYAQDTFHPVSNSQREQVKEYICSVMSARQFSYVYGAQPRTFHKADLALLRNPYAVGLKKDGTRAYIWTGSEGEVWLFYRDKDHPPDGMRLLVIGKPHDNEISKSSMQDLAGCLIEGELDKDGFHAFDLLAFENQDLRGNPEELLVDRLDRLDRVVPAIVKHTTATTLHVKEIQFFLNGDGPGIAQAAQEFMKKYPDAEGLIFTPCDAPYPKAIDEDGNIVRMWSQLLKFKPNPDTVTVDLRVYLTARGRLHPGLYALLAGREVPFRPKLFPEAGDLTSLVQNADVPVADGDIVECRFKVISCPDDIDRLHLIPVRVRLDKSVANSMSVCLDNLHCAIVAPCKMEDFDMVPTAPFDTSRRTDEFWLSQGDLDVYKDGPAVSGFANDIRPLCLPGTGVPGVLATTLAPLPRPENPQPLPPPVEPTRLTEERLEEMKVSELKIECRARGLTVKGVRSDLLARLRPFASPEQN